MKTGIELIAEERQRQIEVEGWTYEHDVEHKDGELANAACVYAMTNDMISFIDDEWGNDMFLHFWPFELEFLKKDQTERVDLRIKDLQKAGALIAAEIDRLNNFNMTQKSKYDENKFTPPFRVGRKQSLAVLDSKGMLVIMFDKGNEKQAELYCDYLNN